MDDYLREYSEKIRKEQIERERMLLEIQNERKKEFEYWDRYALGLEFRFTSFPEQLPEYLETIRKPYPDSDDNFYIAPLHSALNHCELLRNVQKFKILKGIIFCDEYAQRYYWFTIEKEYRFTGEKIFLKYNYTDISSGLPKDNTDDSYDLIPTTDPEFIELKKFKKLKFTQRQKIKEDFLFRKEHSGRNEYYFKSPEECSISLEKVEAALKEVDKISAQMKAPPPEPKPYVYVRPKKSFKENIKSFKKSLNEFMNDNLGLIFIGVYIFIFMVIPYIIISNVFPDGGHRSTTTYEYPEYQLPANARR